MCMSAVIDASTRLIGILGYPVRHSLSPLIHNTALRSQGLNAVYIGLPVPPDRLGDAMAGIRALGFLGANVTIPHKEAVLPLLDSLSGRAQAVGAVNTIVARQGALHGDNTDVSGFLAPLQEHGSWLRGSDMVVLGAGGAARAAVYGLCAAFAPRLLTIAARRAAPAERLASGMAALGNVGTVLLPDAAPQMTSARLIVNATPAGMHPGAGETPWAERTVFRKGQLVYDLVYRPHETRLMREAAAQGARVLGGLPMLLGQAAAAYRQWTGKDMSKAAVEQALEQVLKKDYLGASN